jgi:hypothetical protein
LVECELCEGTGLVVVVPFSRRAERRLRLPFPFHLFRRALPKTGRGGRSEVRPEAGKQASGRSPETPVPDGTEYGALPEPPHEEVRVRRERRQKPEREEQLEASEAKLVVGPDGEVTYRVSVPASDSEDGEAELRLTETGEVEPAVSDADFSLSGEVEGSEMPEQLSESQLGVQEPLYELDADQSDRPTFEFGLESSLAGQFSDDALGAGTDPAFDTERQFGAADHDGCVPTDDQLFPPDSLLGA